MTSVIGILQAAGCAVRDGWVRMSPAARAVLVAAGQRGAREAADGDWLEVQS